jgi:hypothetical protein
MPKIICISSRQPWIEGARYQKGDVIEVTSELVKKALKTGFFEVVEDVNKRENNSRGQQDTSSPKPRRKRNSKRDP